MLFKWAQNIEQKAIITTEQAFFDAWQTTKNNVEASFKNFFPISGRQNVLHLKKIDIDDRLDPTHIKSQLEAKNSGRTWGVPVYGELSLQDKAGNEISKSKIKLCTLPKLTPRYSYIVDGQEYQLEKQWRLKSGIYSRIQENENTQAEFNLLKPFAREPRVYIPFDPESKKYKFKYATANIPLYSILKLNGVSDDEMKKMWGEDIFKANISKDYKKDILKFYNNQLKDRGVQAESDDYEHVATAIKKAFDETGLLEDTTKITMGKPYNKVTGEALLHASKNILDVSARKRPPDNIHSLSFKNLMDIEDYIKEKYENKRVTRSLQTKIRNNLDRKSRVAEIVSSDLFNKPLKTVFTSNSLSQRPEQVNPLEMLSNRSITTITGEGGLQNERAIRPEMKIIHPTHFGFLDPIHTPESFRWDTLIFTNKGWKIVKDLTLEDQVACFDENDKMFFSKPEKIHVHYYVQDLLCAKNSKIQYKVTQNHRMYCKPRYGSIYKFESASEMHEQSRTFKVSFLPYKGNDEIQFFEIDNKKIPIDDWAEFLGWFLSEGSFNKYEVCITQDELVNKENCLRIESLLERLGWPIRKSSRCKDYYIKSKILAEYCSQFGDCYSKYIPDEVINWPISARERLIESLLLGDGRIDSHRATGINYKQLVFTTTSSKLANDFEKIAISLGKSISHKIYPDNREERYKDIHEVRILKHSERTVYNGSKRGIKVNEFYTEPCNGNVYCLTVPGGKVFVKHGSGIGFINGQSEKTGISLHLPLAVKKIGNEAKTFVYDLKEGKSKYVNPTELHSNFVILPDQVKWGADRKPIIPSHPIKMKDPDTHEFTERDPKHARYIVTSAKGLFDDATNLIPFLQNNQGNRTMTASRQATQAVSLSDREAPLVQVQSENPSFTWEKRIGNYFAHRSPVDGHIKKIEKDEHGHPEAIIVNDGKTDHRIEVYNHFPLNDAKTHFNSTLKVKEGDAVKKGAILGDLNFTKDGVLALGSNLHIGYFPYKGLTFEDGLVISEAGAQKLASEHLHRVTLDIDPRKDIINKAKFTAYAQTTSRKLTKEQTEKIDASGLVKPGAKVKSGDLLVTAIGKNELTGQLAMVGARLKGAVNPYKDKSLVWDSDYEGEVVKVIKHPNEKSVTVYIKTREPLQVGDKVCGRHGNKGVVGAIIPDHEMPRVGGPDGKPLDMIMNPSGIASRINIGQMLETAASKIALKTGKPYIVNNFSGKDTDYTQKLKNDLKEHNLKDTDKIYDPVAKTFLTNEAMAGHQYIMKLKHQAEKKLSVRGLDNRTYGINQEPKGGGDHGAQSLGHLELYALLASGARQNIKEISTYKAERPHDDRMADTDFWDRIMLGQPLPPPKPTFAYKKFEGMLSGLGLNIKKEGYKHTLLPMTDKDILANSKGEIKDAGMMRGKNEKEISQGLFDPKTTGGLPTDPGKGLNWTHFKLAEPMPNPVFVGTGKMPGPAVLLTGLKFDEFEKIANGTQSINGKIGGEAIKDMLAKINVEDELKKTKGLLPKLKGAELNQANRKARYLQALKQTGVRPEEAYVLHNIPIMPPIYRPLVPMEDGRVIFSDINYLYSHLIQVSNALKIKKNQPEIPEEEKTRYRTGLYDKLKALAGLGSVPIYEGSRKLKGIIQTIAGDNPKMGFFQSKIMKRRQELSMRGAITPEPAMHIDQVGLPKTSAMELYKPFVVRELMRMGRDILDARKEVKDGSPMAWKALDKAVADRPVLLKRDPVLHKYNIQAFKPVLVDGNSVKLHPLVCGSFNADFDGDTMAAYLPVTEEAKREALEKMLPSKNLFSSTHFGVMHAPDQEAVLGIHMLTNWGKKVNKNYKTPEEIIKDPSLHITDVVHLNNKETTKGRMILAEKLPEKFRTHDMLHNSEYTLKKGSIHNLLEDLAKHDPKAYPDIVNHLKDLGNKYSYDEGFSFRLADLNPLKEERAKILKPYNEEAKAVEMSNKSREVKDEKLIEIYGNATKELDTKLHAEYKKSNNNNIFKMVDTKARGSAASFRQMNIAPMLMKDALNRTIPTPILKSFSEGLDIGDYWTTLHGARKGTLQRVEGTSEPGKLTKEIVNLNISTLITKHDCETKEGINLHLHRPDGKEEEDVHDRVLAKPIKIGAKTYEAGTVITPELFSEAKMHKLDHLPVRSPLTCKEAEGICAKCFGLNENGKFHEVGTNIGVLASQAMGEPATQLAMDSFHCFHKATLVFCKQKGVVSAISMEELFDSVDAEIVRIGHEEIKEVNGDIEIYNGTGKWARLTHVRRHLPDSKMVMVSAGGLLTICQDTHPIGVFPNKINCERCGYHRLKKPSPRSRGKKYYCPSCGFYQLKPEESIGALCFMPPKELEAKRFYLLKDTSLVNGVESPSNLWSGYLCGAYVAEGCVIFDGNNPRRISISQNDGVVKDKIIESAISLNYKLAVTEKCITVNNSELARQFHKLFGRYAANKGLPSNFISYEKEWLVDFLCGLIDGDGTKKSVNDGPDQITIDTTSFKLCQQICFIADKLNIVSSAYLTKNRDLTRNQGFRVSLRITERVKTLLKNSIKIAKIEKLSPAQDVEIIGHTTLTNIKPVFFDYSDFVYDCTTSIGTLIASGLFHHNTGGVAASRGGGSVDKFERLDQLLNIPKILPGAAKLAEKSGAITKIERDQATNGHHVYIGDTKHFVPANRNLTVSVGDQVEKGQKISDGNVNPRHLLPLKGIGAVRDYLAHSLKNEIYKDDTDIRRKNIETVVRNLTNHTRITEPGDSHHLIGDLVHISHVDNYNRNIKPWQKPIQHNPIIEGISQAAEHKDEDYLSRFNFRQIKQNLLQAASQGWSTHVRGLNPVAPVAHGSIGIERNPEY